MWVSRQEWDELVAAKERFKEERNALRLQFEERVERLRAGEHQELHNRIGILSAQLISARMEREHWKREALAYFERLKPFLGNTPAAEPSEKEKAMQAARDLIEPKINRMSNTGTGRDASLEKHLWDYAETQLAERGPEAAEDIAKEIVDGESE